MEKVEKRIYVLCIKYIAVISSNTEISKREEEREKRERASMKRERERKKENNRGRDKKRGVCERKRDSKIETVTWESKKGPFLLYYSK